MNWIYRNKHILSHKDLPDNCSDIVYIISYTDGTRYIGKKSIRSLRRLKPTKAQLAIRKNYKRVEFIDLPFAKYSGSSTENKGKKISSKEILYLSTNKTTATYLEAKLLFSMSVLEDDKYNNKNISGKFFDNCLKGLIL